MLAEPRSYHAAVVFPAAGGLQVLFAGGFGPAVTGPPTYLASGEVLDLASGVSTPTAGDMSAGQAKAQATMLDTGEMLVLAGENQNGPADVELFSPNTATFSPLPAIATPAGAAVVGQGREVLFAGGELSNGITDFVVVYDRLTQVASTAQRLSEPRGRPVATPIPGGSVAVSGGTTTTGASAAVDVVEAGPSPRTTAPETPLQVARWGHTATLRSSGRLIVAGGYDASGRPTASIEDVDLGAHVATNPPPAPVQAIASYPYIERFDAGMGLWSNDAGDDFDWTENQGATPSGGTGPSRDHGGTGSYLFTESSAPNDANKLAMLNGPTFGGFTTLELRFWYHMLGDDPGTGASEQGTLSLDVSTSGGATWDLDVWTLSGNQGPDWQEAIVDLSGYAGSSVTIRFRGVTKSFKSDMAIDDVTVNTSTGPVIQPPPPPTTPVALPYSQDFESGVGVWRDVTGDDFDWATNSGATGSAGTGPSADHTTGSGSYLYTEASYPNNPGTALLEGPTFANFTTLELRFWYHMWSNDPNYAMGTLSLDVSTDAGATWTLDEWTLSGDQGDQWHEAIVDLSAYAGQTIMIRFRGETVSYMGDIAIDDITAQ
jgi:hypothetical protein